MTKIPDPNSTSKQRNQTDSSNRTTKPNKQTNQTNKPNKQTKPTNQPFEQRVFVCGSQTLSPQQLNPELDLRVQVIVLAVESAAVLHRLLVEVSVFRELAKPNSFRVWPAPPFEMACDGWRQDAEAAADAALHGDELVVLALGIGARDGGRRHRP